jgi:putative transposase
MPRTARIAPKENVYHILCRGNNKQIIFKNEHDYQQYLSILKKYKKSHYFLLYHYVLMPNHVHLVLDVTREGKELSEIMKGINLSYVLYYKKKYEHIGHFWQDRYKSIMISKDDYLLACGSYVELNPVRARMVKDPADYPWSSYTTYAHGKHSELVDKHTIYLNLGKESKENQDKYQEFIYGIQKEKKFMKGEMNKKILYGSKEFLDDMKRKFNIGSSIKNRGRPRK